MNKHQKELEEIRATQQIIFSLFTAIAVGIIIFSKEIYALLKPELELISALTVMIVLILLLVYCLFQFQRLKNRRNHLLAKTKKNTTKKK